jgi:hypothetical protein
MEIAFVELTGAVLFREEKHEGGIMAYQVYAIQTEKGIVAIRTGRIRHKRIGIYWIRDCFARFLMGDPKGYSRTERVKLLIKELKIKKVYWKYEITEKMYTEIMNCLEVSQIIYDNKNNSR